MPTTLAILAIAPALAICGYIIHKDRFNKEPFWLLLLAFGFGVFSTFPAAIGSQLAAGFVINDGQFINTAIYAFLVVALSEEFAKFYFLRYILFKRKEFNEPLDGIVYAVMIGMGFAAFENVLYVAQGGFNVAIARMLTAIPAHAVFAIVMGYYVGLAKFDIVHKEEFLRKALLYPVLLHGTYDFLLLQKVFPALSIFAFIGLFQCVRYVRTILAQPQNNPPM